jgi:hypothetical protein
VIFESIYFTLPEFVCGHVYDKYGLVAWQFFDIRLLVTIEKIREYLNKPIIINNWQTHGSFSQRGLRCVQCDLMKSIYQAGTLFVDPHAMGQAVDFDVQGLVSEEVRQWIIKNQNILPYPIRLEAGVTWCHLDIRDASKGKVYIFNI